MGIREPVDTHTASMSRSTPKKKRGLWENARMHPTWHFIMVSVTVIDQVRAQTMRTYTTLSEQSTQVEYSAPMAAGMIAQGNGWLPLSTSPKDTGWLYKPPSHALVQNDTPALVILCTWTAARLEHIAIYTKMYQKMFEGAPIVVILTSAKDMCFRSSQKKQDRLKLVVDSIKHCLNTTKSEGILMHAFSDGGSNKACELAEAYKKTTRNNSTLPVWALYLDSTPGCPRYRNLCNALSKSVPSIPVVRHTGVVFCGAVVGVIWSFYKIRGFDTNVISMTRKRLLGQKLFGHEVPRYYIYSKNDSIVDHGDVTGHYNDSANAGFTVGFKEFEGTEHVKHAHKHHKEEYWNFIQSTWTMLTFRNGRRDGSVLTPSQEKGSSETLCGQEEATKP